MHTVTVLADDFICHLPAYCKHSKCSNETHEYACNNNSSNCWPTKAWNEI